MQPAGIRQEEATGSLAKGQRYDFKLQTLHDGFEAADSTGGDGWRVEEARRPVPAHTEATAAYWCSREIRLCVFEQLSVGGQRVGKQILVQALYGTGG